MAKKTLVREHDKFMLRLPNGMRDRIKAKADRAGMSMNEAIVWCLGQYFPAPTTLHEKIAELVDMAAALRKGNDFSADVDRLIDEMDTVLRGVADGKIKAAESFRQHVSERLTDWDEMASEEWQATNENPFSENDTDSADDPFDIDRTSKSG